jgi:2-keto-4-pentenoate hydratase/2-oxohepta-3-ene-1,7-dioic acid hydratase in catechol pathway
MRLITYAQGPGTLPRLAVRVGHRVLDVESASRVDGEPLPSTMKGLLREGRGAISRVQALAKAAQITAGRFAGAMLEEKAIRFLPPIPDPGRLRCVAVNHRARFAELRSNGLMDAMPVELSGYEKADPVLVGHNTRVAKPATIARLDYEPELVLVIGRRALGLGEDVEAVDYVAGLTLLNDFVDRDGQKRGAQSGEAHWTGKHAPGFAVLGPEVVTLDEIGDLDDLWMTCSVNGEERLRVNTVDQVWRIEDMLATFSRDEALEPGDLISMGVPGGTAMGRPGTNDHYLKPGDVVECAMEGLTTLRTTIVAA